MKLQVLGCSGGIGQSLHTSTYLINDHFLVDAGTGVTSLSPSQLLNISGIAITHAHLDHILGIGLLADSIYEKRPAPLWLYAMPETRTILEKHIFNWQIWPDFTKLPTPERPTLIWYAATPLIWQKLDEFELMAIPLKHTIPSFAWAFREANTEKVFVICGDTSSNQTLWAALNDLPRVDAIVIEVSFGDQDHCRAIVSGHYTPALLAADLQQLRHRPRLYFTHHKPGQTPAIHEDRHKHAIFNEFICDYLSQDDILAF